MIKNCPMRHENGNCIPAGGFCTANKNICEALHNAYRMGKAQLSSEGTTSDMISRQAVIDALDVLCQEHRYRIPGKRETYSEYNEAWQDALGRAEGVIGNLPTIQPEPTDIDAREAVYNLAEKIGIHQLFALTVELRGEPIQPEPQEGHWIWVAGELMCSECRTIYSDLYPDYDNAVACPHCGAKMKGERQK